MAKIPPTALEKLWHFSIKRADVKDGEKLFTKVCSERGQQGATVLSEGGRFGLNIRKKLFTVSVMRHCTRLQGEVVHVPSLEAFKTSLDGDQANLI